jgi:hypothetical protein
MPKAENKKMLQIYLAAIAIFSTTVGVISIVVMVAYATNDQNNNDNNDVSPQNRACYNAGLADGQKNSPYSQSMVNQCGVNGHAYYQGFISGCITGQGKDFFSCQRLTNAPIGGGGSSNAGASSGNNNNGGGGGQ